MRAKTITQARRKRRAAILRNWGRFAVFVVRGWITPPVLREVRK